MSEGSWPTIQDWLDGPAGVNISDALAQDWRITAACWIARDRGLA
ncbi:hypothetical protein AAGT00_35285 (plasmid) [Streptomyces cavourensis]